MALGRFMKTSRQFLTCVTLALTFVGAKASITSITDSSYAYDGMWDATVGTYYSASGTGVPTNFVDNPGSVWGPYGYNYISGSYTSNFTALSSSYAQVNATFNAATLSNSVYGVAEQGWFGGYDTITFMTDSAAIVTLAATNTSEYAYNSGPYAFNSDLNYLYLDGTTYLSSAVDGSVTVLVGAGSHQAFFQSDVNTYARNGFSSYDSLHSNYQVSISSGVPEPASMAVLGVAAIGLIRRRTKRTA